jgi:hypothetical protein
MEMDLKTFLWWVDRANEINGDDDADSDGNK